MLTEKREKWIKENGSTREKIALIQREAKRDLKHLSKGADPIWGLVQGAMTRAQKKGMDFDLDKEWCVIKNTGFCELTGLPYQKGNGQSNAMSPSIDKIDPSLGYTKDNCRVILFGVNLLKFNDNDKTMYRIAEALVSNRKNSVVSIT